MNSYAFSAEPGLAEQLQRICREEMKLRLLTDIKADMSVCVLEGYSPYEYIDDLIELLEGLKPANNQAETRCNPLQT